MNTTFIEYDPLTGFIIKSGNCPEENYPPPQDGNGVYKIVEHQYNPLAYKVDLATGQVVPK